MARVLYFDCFSGISGDMALGALLDAGLPFDRLQAALGSLALGDAHVHAERVLRAGVTATKFSVHEHRHGDGAHAHAHEHRHDDAAHTHSHSHDDPPGTDHPAHAHSHDAPAHDHHAHEHDVDHRTHGDSSHTHPEG